MRKWWIGCLLGVSIAFISGAQAVYAETAQSQSEGQALKAQVKTKEEAIKQLDGMFPKLWSSYHLWDAPNSRTAILRSGDQVIAGGPGSNAGRSDMATTVAYLLEDDYETGTLYGFGFSQDGALEPIKAAAYIYKEGKYHIFDPALEMGADESSRGNGYFENRTLDTLEAFGTYIAQTDDLKSKISQIYAVPGGEGIQFTVNPDTLSVQVDHEKAKLLYSNTELANERFKHIKPERIGEYKLPKILGGLTLSVEEAKALVGQSPQEVKEQVQTAGDLLLYMLASETILENGDAKVWVGGLEWHLNRRANEVLSLKRGNCGSMANLANYLLEGDYEEIGFILHSYYPGNGGGHVYNYIKYQGEYYIVDFSSYLFNNYNTESEFNFIKMNQLSDYGTRWNECYSGLAAIIAHKSPGTHLPNVWSGKNYYLPEGAEFEVLLETPKKGYKVDTIYMSTVVPDWKVPQQGELISDIANRE